MLFESGDLNANTNSSYPKTHTIWEVFVNNGSHQNSSLSVYAICAKQTSSWGIRSRLFTDSTTGTTFGAAQCPKTTQILGGGVFSPSISLGENVGNEWPQVTGQGITKTSKWRVRMTSQNNGGSTFHVYAICGTTPGYKLVKGPATTIPTMRQTSAEASCPAPRVPLSGGAQFNGAQSPFLNMNSTLPIPSKSSWLTWQSNGGASDRTVIPYAICAGT